MRQDELHYLTATEALALFRARKLSPVELMDAVIARAEATEPVINALTFRHFEEARRSARVAESRYSGRGASPRPLEGLPVAIKDSGHVAGYPTSAGSLTTGDAVAARTSPLNERVLDAGAIMHARSATPEFSCAAATHSLRWGVTRNPWNLAYAPGGSSGGAGAALAAGSTVLATGSDIAGSIRVPASCCGVVGYKPPRGRNPVDPPFNLDPYCHTGPMARSVADTIALQNVMSGPLPGDPTLLPERHVLPDGYEPIAGMRIGWSVDMGIFVVDAAVRHNTRMALDIFADLGAELVEIDPGWDETLLAAAMTHLRSVFGTSIALEMEGTGVPVTGYARAFADAGLGCDARDVFNSVSVAVEAGARFCEAMDGLDLFVAPTTAIASVPAEFDFSRDTLAIDGRTVDPMIGWLMTVPFNMLGAHPVLSVPSGRTPDGVPTGLQIVGRPFRDGDVFRAGLAYEQALGGWFRTADTRPGIAAATGQALTGRRVA